MNRPHHYRNRDRRGGYTLAELMAVIVIAGVIATIAVPRLSSYIRHLSARSAASTVVSDLMLARTQAVREGQTVSLRVTSAAEYQLTVDANPVRTLKTVNVAGTQKSVTLGPNGTTISFDPRGMLRAGSGSELRITRGTQTDTISITGVGRVYRANGN
jgi:type IV fimbrial biogenesis protein FimT